jgi:hypothetical protein
MVHRTTYSSQPMFRSLNIDVFPNGAAFSGDGLGFGINSYFPHE